MGKIVNIQWIVHKEEFFHYVVTYKWNIDPGDSIIRNSTICSSKCRRCRNRQHYSERICMFASGQRCFSCVRNILEYQCLTEPVSLQPKRYETLYDELTFYQFYISFKISVFSSVNNAFMKPFSTEICVTLTF